MISVNLAFNGYVGLSTDTKPTEDVNNGSRFYEMDTGKNYMYDAEGQQWLEQSSEGGSGGGGSIGGGLVVVWAVYDDDSLDKTWQEIHDAMAAGTPVTMVGNNDTYNDCGVVFGCASYSGHYEVHAHGWNGTYFTEQVFMADAADGYPTRVGS